MTVSYSKEEDDDVARFERHDCWEIMRALKRIDRVRGQLIHAQNMLVHMLEYMSENTRYEFADFYPGGGVTAEEWKRWVNDGGGINNNNVVARGQLRLIVPITGRQQA
jgi:hypothetical protein